MKVKHTRLYFTVFRILIILMCFLLCGADIYMSLLAGENPDIEVIVFDLAACVMAWIMSSFWLKTVVRMRVEETSVELEQLNGKIVSFDMNEIEKIIQKESLQPKCQVMTLIMKDGKKYRINTRVARLHMNYNGYEHEGISPGEFCSIRREQGFF